MAALAAAVAAAFPAGAFAATGGAGSAAAPRAGERAEAGQLALLRRLVGQTRRQHGLNALHASVRLNRSARLRALAIGRCGQISHTPCGQSFISVFRRAGYARGSYTVGENLAWGTGSLASAENAVRGWLASPPHRANLLSRRWRDIGIARIVGPGGGAVWVAQFGRSR